MSNYITIKLRRGTAAQWTATNPVLAEGEVGLETDTRKFKVGTGAAAWNSLQYWGGSGGGAADFTDLGDVPASYSGAGSYYVKVKETADGLEFEPIEAADLPSGIDAAKIANGTISNTEFQTLNGAEQPFTNALKTKLDGVETGADVTDADNVGSVLNAATSKTTPVDADTLPLSDSAAAGGLKKLTWANLKATAKTYFDTIYQAALGYTPVNKAGDTGVGSLNIGSNTLTAATIQANSSAGGIIKSSSGSAVAEWGAGGGQNITFEDGVKLNGGTASRILATDASKNVQYLDTATYPSLTELAYVKGVTSAVQTQLDGKVDENSAITGATKTKITYDAKGLVTAGADATTADIADSNDKRYVTEAEKTKLSNLSGTNTGDQNLFSTIAVSGQSNVVADTTGDTLTLVAGSNVTITTDASTDTITIAASGGGGSIADGDKGDITVSSSGTVWTIDNGAVSLAKMADMATSSLIYRKTAGTGAPEVQSLSTLKTDLGLTGTNSGDQTITLTGDVTGSGTGSFAATIANDAVTFAKMQNSAAAGLSVIGRSTNSAGDFAEINAGSDGHVLRRSGTAVGFGTLASGAFASNTVSRAALVNATALSVIGRSANSSGAPADIAAANDGEVLRRSGTTLGFGTIATAGIADDAVTNAKLANMANATIKGRTTAGTGDPEDLTGTQATALLDAFTSSLKGLAPASGGGTTNFLRADGTWAAPAGGSLSDGDKGDITVSSSGTVWTIDNGAVSDAKLGTAINADKIANGQVSNTEFQYLDGVTSAIQTQLNAKVTGFADPNADRIVFWDDSASAYAALEVGSGLSISGTTLTASGGGGGDLTVLNSNNTQTGLLNTSTETALYSFNLPTDLAAGETLILEMAGQYRNDVGTTPTWTPRIKLGGNTIMQRAAGFGNSTTRSWIARVVINIVSTSSQKVSMISHHIGDGPGALANTLISGVAMHFAGYDTASEDTTTTKALEFTMQVSAASASSWIYCEMATLYRLSAP